MNGAVAARRRRTISQRPSSASIGQALTCVSSTVDWFRRNAERLSLERSLETVLEAYAGR